MTIRLTIDGQPVEADNGATILQAARQKGVCIPTLCDLPALPPHGSCRLCIVEIEGSSRTPTACTTPVQEGMVVQTNTPRLNALRSDVLRLLLSEHPLSCLVCPEKHLCDQCMVTIRKASVTTGCGSCPKDDLCELQTLVDTIGLGESLHPPRYRGLPVECGDPFFDRDYNLCVLCGRCVRICESLHFSGTLTYTNRGSETLVGTAYGRSHLAAGCSFCGSCVEVCPTGALSEKTRKWEGVPEGKVQSTCVLCGLGCSLHLLTKKGVVIGSLPNSGHLCVKGRFGITELVSHPYRLMTPQQIVEGRGMAIGWDAAITAAVKLLTNCPPGGFAMRVSADLCSEDLYVAQKFARVVMGTSEVAIPASDAYGSALNGIVRLVKSAVTLDALQEADAIVCLELDTRHAQSVVETNLLRAHQRGAKLYTIHPNEHSLSFHSDLWLRPRPGLAVTLLGTLGDLIEGKAVVGAEEDLCYLADALQEAHNLVMLIGPDGLRQPDAAQWIEAVERLAQLTGARVIPLLAESNLVGSFFTGAHAALLPGGAATDPQLRKRIARLWERPLQEPALAGQPSLLYLIGVQPPASAGVPIIYQNIDQCLDGQRVALTLPTAAFSEIDGTVVNTNGQVLILHKAVQPPGEALPSWQILSRIAQAMNVPGFAYANVHDVQAEMAKLINGYQPGGRLSMKALNPTFGRIAQPTCAATGVGVQGALVVSTQISQDTYMGFPMMRRVEGLRDLSPADQVFISPEDAEREGIVQGDPVVVCTPDFEHIWPAHLDRRQQPGTLRVMLSEEDTTGIMTIPAEIRKTNVHTD